jgi:hypothetical protein
MAHELQKDRIYSLIVGTEGDAVEINNLQIKFKVEKTSSNKDKKNSAYVEIYNLSEDRRVKLEEDYVQVSLSVGYADTQVLPLFQGQVRNITSSKLDNFLTKRQGTELVTRLDIDELYTILNGKSVSAIVPAGKSVRSVIERLIQDIPEVTRQEMNGEAVNQVLPNGYPMNGSPRQILDNLSRDYSLEWQIDGGVLYISDSDGTYSDDKSSVFSIGQFSGLIDRPQYINEEAKRLRRLASGRKTNKTPKKNSVKFKILMNPAINAGSIIYLDFETLTGYYKVDEIIHEGDFRGNDWYSTLVCTEKLN